ncbi:alpha-ketoglutarate-dependent dioxygenase AlkB [Catenovulum sediminis]|uniref:Alpha-ketoglutarate-dependent dioxygenase AlkB n=2 Tax=Catenovulum sediminis TaxID=1740262 RepID=A0ABV1RL02_9ALTE
MSKIQPQHINLPNSELYYYPNLLELGVAQQWYQWLYHSLNWRQESLVVYGKAHKIPRLQAFCGDSHFSYSYSGKKFKSEIWPQGVKQLAELATQTCGAAFNSVLANLYRDGKDCMGWHADDEAELGKAPVIASFSFGQPRIFKLKHRLSAQQYDIELSNGSLLIMAGCTQEFWYHSLPKRLKLDKGRINLTFRYIHT